MYSEMIGTYFEFLLYCFDTSATYTHLHAQSHADHSHACISCQLSQTVGNPPPLKQKDLFLSCYRQTGTHTHIHTFKYQLYFQQRPNDSSLSMWCCCRLAKQLVRLWHIWASLWGIKAAWQKTQASWIHEHGDWNCWSSCNLLYVVSWKCLLSSRSADDLRIGGLIVPFLSAASPKKPFPLMCSGTEDHGFIRVSKIPVSSWNAKNAWKAGQSAAAWSDISFDVFREWVMKGESVYVCFRNRNGVSEKEKEREAYGWKDRQREAWIYADRNVSKNKGGLHWKTEQWRIQYK